MPLRLIRADITTMNVDAIVNAANPQLKMGGGVCGAIFRAAGPQALQAACDQIAPCPTGSAVITPGFELNAKYVIHTPGPVWHGGHENEETLLRSCYTQSLRLAARHELTSVAFPLISAGVYGYPRQQALQTAVSAISDFLTDPRSPDMDVTLVLYDRCSYREGGTLFGRIASYLDENSPSFLRHEREKRFRSLMNDTGEESVMLGSLPNTSASFPEPPPQCSAAPMAAPPPRSASLADKMRSWTNALGLRKEETFSQHLLHLIDQSGEKDSVIYKRANVDRRLFSKIRSNPNYQPGKNTVLAFCLALRLSVRDAQTLLGKAGYALTHTSQLDLAVEFCLRNEIYDVHQVNAALYELDLPLLGS